MKRLSTATAVPAIVATTAAFGVMASSASAITIYSDTFTGSSTPGTLNGAAPNTADANGATWTANSAWSDSGYSNSGSSIRLSAFLPFTPVGGQIYTLSAGFDVTKQTDPADTVGSDYWFALGFLINQSTNQGWDFGGASPWALDGLYSVSGGVDYTNSGAVTGPGPAGAQVFGPYITPGVNYYSIVLDTVQSAWTYGVYLTNSGESNLLVGSSSVFPFSSNPIITAVGFQNGKGAGYVSDFSLTDVAVPEPTSLSLVAIAGMGMLLLKRRRKNCKVM